MIVARSHEMNGMPAPGIAAILFCGVAFAHHGTNASYDLEKTVTMKATVTEFVWINPHCQLYFDVKDDKGKLVHWGGETNSPGVLARSGWSKTILKPGDEITITVHPSRAGTPFGVIQRIQLGSGTVLERGAGAGQ
jgi:hypothetical protein